MSLNDKMTTNNDKGDNMKTKQNNDEDGKRKKNFHSTAGIWVFLGEINRVSKTPGFAFFCTPGHNRGAAYEVSTAVQIPIMLTEKAKIVA